MCAEGSAEKAVAATNGKKINAPSQTARASSSRKRKMVIREMVTENAELVG